MVEKYMVLNELRVKYLVRKPNGAYHIGNLQVSAGKYNRVGWCSHRKHKGKRAGKRCRKHEIKRIQIDSNGLQGSSKKKKIEMRCILAGLQKEDNFKPYLTLNVKSIFIKT